MPRTTVDTSTPGLMAQLRALYAAVPVGVGLLDTDLRFIHVNQRLANITGVAADAHTGLGWHDIAPAVADELDTLCRDALTTGVPVTGVDICRAERGADGDSPAGATRPDALAVWRVGVTPVVGDAGDITGLTITLQDVTARKRDAEALRDARASADQRQAFLHAVADRLPRAFVYRVVHRADGSMYFTYLSKGVEAVVGHTADELFENADLVLQRIVEEDRSAFMTAMLRALETFTPFDFACRVRWLDGSLHWSHFRSAVRSLDDGTLACEGLMVDVTDQKRAEDALQDSQARNDAILAALPDIMFLQTADGIYLDAHVADPRQLLVPKDVFMGRRMHEFLPADLVAAFEACFRQVLREGASSYEYSLPLNGETRHFEARMVKCGTNRILTIVRDLTENRRALLDAQASRAELARVSRLTLLGEITASLAHELNQPLATILANAQAGERLLDSPQADVADLREILADIVEADQRAGQVIRRTRAWLTRDEPIRQPITPANLFAEVDHVIRSEAIRRQARLTIDLPPALPVVLADKVQIQQVLVNLLLNAMEAMQELPPHLRRLAVRAVAEDATVRIDVCDAGTGIEPDHLTRLFDPFFTTKATGLGIGLRICASIVDAHGGRIWAANNTDGPGATFHFTLPIAVS